MWYYVYIPSILCIHTPPQIECNFHEKDVEMVVGDAVLLSVMLRIKGKNRDEFILKFVTNVMKIVEEQKLKSLAT
jgi:hypothetical protein